MAKLFETVGFMLFFLFAAHARFPSDLLPLNEGINIKPSKNLLHQSDSKPTTTIILPSERAEPESRLPETYIRAPKSIPKHNKESKSNDVTPLEIITLRKMKRHFPRRPFPFGSHCREQDKLFRPWGSHPQGRKEIPYGDDMILSSNADRRFDPTVRSTIPTRWITVGRFPDDHDDINIDHRNEHDPFHQLRHHHHHPHRHEERKIEEDQHDHEQGFLKSFRKFLAHI